MAYVMIFFLIFFIFLYVKYKIPWENQLPQNAIKFNFRFLPTPT